MPSGHERLEERALWLANADVAKLRADPEGVLTLARQNLKDMSEVHPRSKPYFDVWEQLLNGPLDQLVDMMLSTTQEARDLRQCSPFAGVLTPQERWEVFYKFREYEKRQQGEDTHAAP